MPVLQTDILLSVLTHLGEFYVNELKPEVTYMVWKLSLFPLRWRLTVWYLSIICVPLYYASLELQIVLKVYCINLGDRLDRSETWNYIKFIESRDWDSIETTVKNQQICYLAFHFNYLNVTYNADNDCLAMCKID